MRFSKYNVYITNQFQIQILLGGGGGSIYRVIWKCKEENAKVLWPNCVQEYGLRAVVEVKPGILDAVHVHVLGSNAQKIFCYIFFFMLRDSMSLRIVSSYQYLK